MVAKATVCEGSKGGAQVGLPSLDKHIRTRTGHPRQDLVLIGQGGDGTFNVAADT